MKEQKYTALHIYDNLKKCGLLHDASMTYYETMSKCNDISMMEQLAINATRKFLSNTMSQSVDEQTTKEVMILIDGAK